MSTEFLSPGYFTGSREEDARAWLRDTERWCAYKNLDQKATMGAVGLLLRDSAKAWINRQNEKVKSDFGCFIDAFLAEYVDGYKNNSAKAELAAILQRLEEKINTWGKQNIHTNTANRVETE
jgi:hypothetical protein